MKTNCNCCTAAELFHYYCLVHSHSLITATGAHYRRSACIEYQSAIRASCGSCLLRYGLNFGKAWCTMRLISRKKDWKRVSMQKVVTLNTCCDGRCLPDIPVATHHNRFFAEPPMPTHNWLFSEPPKFEGTQQTFSQMN